MKIKYVQVYVEGELTNPGIVRVPFEEFCVHVMKCQQDSGWWDEKKMKPYKPIIDGVSYK